MGRGRAPTAHTGIDLTGAFRTGSSFPGLADLSARRAETDPRRISSETRREIRLLGSPEGTHATLSLSEGCKHGRSTPNTGHERRRRDPRRLRSGESPLLYSWVDGWTPAPPSEAPQRSTVEVIRNWPSSASRNVPLAD